MIKLKKFLFYIYLMEGKRKMEEEIRKHTNQEVKDFVKEGIEAYGKIGEDYNKYLEEKCTKEEKRGEDKDDRE